MIKNFLSLGVIQLCNYLTPLIILPLLINRLGIEGYGEYCIFISKLILCDSIIGYGFRVSGPTQLSKINDESKIKYLISEIFIAKSIIFLCISSMLIFLINEYQFILLVLYLFGRIIAFEWVFEGLTQMQIPSILHVINKIFQLIIILIFVKDFQDINKAFIAYTLPFIINGLIILLIIKKKYSFNFKKITINRIFERYKNDFNVFISQLGTNLYTTTNVMIIGMVTNNYNAGIYATAEKIYRLVGSISQLFIKSLYPYLGRIYTENKEIYRKELIKFSYLLIILFIIISALTYFVLPFITNSILGIEKYEQRKIIRLLCLVLLLSLPMFALGGLSTYQLVIQNKSKIIRNIVLLFGFLNIILVYICTIYFGIFGASIVVSLTIFFIGMGTYINSIKNVN